MPQPERYVRAKVECSAGHLHDICIEIPRQVPPDLRCAEEEPRGFGQGPGGGCSIPSQDQLKVRAAQELQDGLEESRRRGYVLIRA